MPIGWLSPSGEFFKCDFLEHIYFAEKLAKQLGASEEDHYDDYLLNHGWVHLTVTTFFSHGWAVIFPYNVEHLTVEQHNFLKPYVEENINFLSDVCKTDLKYEFEDLFQK